MVATATMMVVAMVVAVAAVLLLYHRADLLLIPGVYASHGTVSAF